MPLQGVRVSATLAFKCALTLILATLGYISLPLSHQQSGYYIFVKKMKSGLQKLQACNKAGLTSTGAHGTVRAGLETPPPWPRPCSTCTRCGMERPPPLAPAAPVSSLSRKGF